MIKDYLAATAALKRPLLGLGLLVALTSSPADGLRANEAPACTRASLGQTACFSPRLCECIYDRGGAMTGVPEGFRWKCDIMKPYCGEAANVPATIIEYRGTPPSYPAAVGIDRSSESVDVNQDGTNTNTNTSNSTSTSSSSGD